MDINQQPSNKQERPVTPRECTHQWVVLHRGSISMYDLSVQLPEYQCAKCGVIE